MGSRRVSKYYSMLVDSCCPLIYTAYADLLHYPGTTTTTFDSTKRWKALKNQTFNVAIVEIRKNVSHNNKKCCVLGEVKSNFWYHVKRKFSYQRCFRPLLSSLQQIIIVKKLITNKIHKKHLTAKQSYKTVLITLQY